MSYPLQLGVGLGVGNPCPDQYSQASTLECPETVRLTFSVYNQGIFLQVLGVSSGGGEQGYGTEDYYGPGFYSLDRKCSRVRVRNAVAGKAAAVSISALTIRDMPDA